MRAYYARFLATCMHDYTEARVWYDNLHRDGRAKCWMYIDMAKTYNKLGDTDGALLYLGLSGYHGEEKALFLLNEMNDREGACKVFENLIMISENGSDSYRPLVEYAHFLHHHVNDDKAAMETYGKIDFKTYKYVNDWDIIEYLSLAIEGGDNDAIMSGFEVLLKQPQIRVLLLFLTAKAAMIYIYQLQHESDFKDMFQPRTQHELLLLYMDIRIDELSDGDQDESLVLLSMVRLMTLYPSYESGWRSIEYAIKTGKDTKTIMEQILCMENLSTNDDMYSEIQATIDIVGHTYVMDADILKKVQARCWNFHPNAERV